MNSPIFPKVRATIEAIWNLAEVWGQSDFPLSQVLANLQDHCSDDYSETASAIFLAFQDKFSREYAKNSIRGLALKPQSSLRTVVNCPSIVGLECLRDFENQTWMTDPSEYILVDPSFRQKPQRMHVEICVRQETNNIMMYTSANSARFDPFDKTKYPDGRSVYIPGKPGLGVGCKTPNNSLALIRRFADFLFFTPRMSAYLNANEMGRTGLIYSALMSMASKIDGTAELRPVTDRYSSTIDSVMDFAKVYHAKTAIHPIQWKAFNSFLGQGAVAPITPLFRSKNGTKTSRDPRDYDTPRDWQDYQENRHRPKIRLKGYGIEFVPNPYSCFSDFYLPSTSSKELPFPSSARWNYQSSRFLFASARVAESMMYGYKLADLDRLQKIVQVATQLVADLSKFERSFMRFFATDLFLLKNIPY